MSLVLQQFQYEFIVNLLDVSDIKIMWKSVNI